MIKTLTIKFHTALRRARTIPLGLVLILGIVALFLGYLWQTNAAATSIYRLNAVEQQREEALSRLEKLDLQLAEFQSTAELSRTAEELGLEQPRTVHYLSPTALDVAVILPE